MISKIENVDEIYLYRVDLEKRERCGVHERLTEPRVTMESLLAKPRSFSYIPAFLDFHGSKCWFAHSLVNALITCHD